MSIQCLKMAWESIKSNKMRSFLTMLGIIIGVTALVTLVSLVNGATGAITSQVESLGNDMLMVTVMDDKSAPLRLENLEEISRLDGVRQASPSGSMNARAKRGSTETSVSVYGVLPAYADIQGLELDRGRFLKTADVDNRSYVAVLSHDLHETLFGDEDGLDQFITVGGRSFRVVGVLKESDSMMVSMMNSGTLYVPFTVESRMAGQPVIMSFYVSSSGSTDDAETAVNQYLLRRFQQDEDSFSILNMSSVSSAMDTITGTLSLLLGGIAAISLLVGGIGIMNIMLVSVTERTREIGIRKSLGAKQKDIRGQFVIEAGTTSAVGGVLGIVFGLLLARAATIAVGAIMSSSMNGITFSAVPTLSDIAVSFGVSVGIGVLFGYLPANKAAKLNPIDALRYD